jgi:acetyltransferase-like isoleucine patch superfamily enzyme
LALKNKQTSDIEVLHKNLKSLHHDLRKKMKSDWDRVLPFNELLFDRWEKASFLKSAKNANIYDSSYVFGDVSIGEKTWIGPFTILDGSGAKIKIGKYCSISSGTQIYTHDTVEWSLTGGNTPFKKGSVSIGDFCYIGPHAIISKNVKIGKCSVIGANTLVNSKIPPYSIVFGNPGKIVGKVKVKGKKVILEY